MRRPVDYSRYVRDLERRDRTHADDGEGPDSPETQISGLPPLEGVPEEALPLGGQNITIQPDSLVQVRVEEDPSLNGSYPVNSLGAIELGYVGPVILYNRTETSAAKKIEEVLRTRDFKNATVSVRILRASYDKVRVAGAVNKDGVIKIGAGDAISLNDALLRAGGLRASVRGARVKIVRSGLLSAVAPALKGEEYSLVTDDGLPSVPSVWLRNNDVAFVFSAAEEVSREVASRSILVLGHVKREGVYVFKGSEQSTIMYLLFKMGGLPPYANGKKIQVIRRDADGFEYEYIVNALRILERGDPEEDFELENGDRVIVKGRRLSLF